MAAYAIAEIEVADPEAYSEYREGVPATLEPFGGRFLVRGGRHETLEGSWEPQRVVILEFPSVDQAKAWHASPEYQRLVRIRQQHAHTRFLTVVEGVQPG